ncbi:MAG TPA: hypothetical protein VHM65_06180, partial [Candidatus Lustribacter sp.]|nr:hypothetical protein [Candidatus Lustribacter sp.]
RDGPGARAHLPSLAWRTARTALERGPVLIQVPRRGYLPALSCQSCRAPVHCLRCKGPVAVAAQGAAAACRWCGTLMGADGFVCPHCEGRALRSTVVGAGRTAEELGRAFAGVPVHTSGGEAVLGRVSAAPGLVIATPGAEPVAEGGYAAVLLLDAWALLDRPSLDAGSEALRRWMAAAALARTRADGGVVVLAGAPGQVTLAPVEALVRWDPGWLAERELAERRELRLPPAVTMAQVVGSRHTLAEVLACAELPGGAERFGPLPRSAGPGRHDQQGLLQVLLRVEPAERAALAAALAHVRAVRSARKETDPLTIRLDPADPVA